MRREHMEHLVAAAATICGEDEFVVIGSQAMLGSHPAAKGELVVSMELDLYPMHSPEKADEIDGALGDGSRFQQTFGYYAHGVGPETAEAPSGWQRRLVVVAIPPRPRSERNPVAHCLEPHDLVLAKCVAGRERDWVYAEEAMRSQLVGFNELLRRIPLLPVRREAQAVIEKTLAAIS